MCEAVSRWLPPEEAAITSFKVRYHRTHAPGLVRSGNHVLDPLGRLKMIGRDFAIPNKAFGAGG